MKRLTLVTIACAIAAVSIFAASAQAAATPDPTKACKKGWYLEWAPNTSADSDGNGFICVDPTTGDERDDKGQFTGGVTGAAGVDINGDAFVCLNRTTGAVTDDDIVTDPDGTIRLVCPTGFVAVPVFVGQPPPQP